jgi:hypothetical protein
MVRIILSVIFALIAVWQMHLVKLGFGHFLAGCMAFGLAAILSIWERDSKGISFASIAPDEKFVFLKDCRKAGFHNAELWKRTNPREAISTRTGKCRRPISNYEPVIKICD